MSYMYSRFSGFGQETDPDGGEQAISVSRTIAPARSAYEVLPTLIRPTVAATPEPIPTPIQPTLVSPSQVTIDSQIFPDAGWAPVAPSAPTLQTVPYVTAGPAPVVISPLNVEQFDSVAQSVQPVTSMPLDSQMAQSDAALTQSIQTRGLPTQSTLTASIAPGAPSYQAPLTDQRFTDPYRDPSRFVDQSTRPDMEPDYTLIPKTPLIPQSERTQSAYIQDAGLTNEPVEDVLAPLRSPETASLLQLTEEKGFSVPRGADAIQFDDDSVDIPTTGDLYTCPTGWVSVAPGQCSRVGGGGDLPTVPEQRVLAQRKCPNGGQLVFDKASGQSLCVAPVAAAVAPASSTPWLLIGAVGLAALFLLKKD